MSYLDKIKELTETLSNVELNLKKEYAILEFVLEDTSDGYWDWNVVTNYEYLSPKFKAQLGYKVDELAHTPESWMRLCNPEDLARAKVTISKILSGEFDGFSERLRFTHKDGSEVNVLCSGKLVGVGKNGEPLRMVGTHKIIK
jgi:PAS domain S-box-containing protein